MRKTGKQSPAGELVELLKTYSWNDAVRLLKRRRLPVPQKSAKPENYIINRATSITGRKLRGGQDGKLD
ncbi:hypothetical protein ES702_03946 [subsurface metagenome]